ncbi:hypothetical protein EVAR_46947_1 [Eumeta japonica]|uniref:Uncharacterized protein n=1 Tax=Eumeta variegata TaxID=151549 RepID=A0A4C1YN57_EUMVA|nr:hypothetical protein EVAR_46947_1 [Eumeta japonica]
MARSHNSFLAYSRLQSKFDRRPTFRQSARLISHEDDRRLGITPRAVIRFHRTCQHSVFAKLTSCRYRRDMHYKDERAGSLSATVSHREPRPCATLSVLSTYRFRHRFARDIARPGVIVSLDAMTNKDSLRTQGRRKHVLALRNN